MRRHSLPFLLLLFLFLLVTLCASYITITVTVTAAPHGVVPVVLPGFGFRRMVGTDSVTPDCADPTSPACRMSATISAYQNLLIVFGGLQQNAFSDVLYNDLWTYRTGYPAYDGAWQMIQDNSCGAPGRPTCRHRHTSLILGSTMLVFGGFNSNNDILNDLWSLNLPLVQNSGVAVWTQLPSLTINGVAKGFASHVAVALDDNRMFMYGSTDINNNVVTYTNLIVIFNKLTNTYTLIPNTPANGGPIVPCDYDPNRPCVSSSAGVVFNNLIYLFGGSTMISANAPTTFSNALWSITSDGATSRMIQPNQCVSIATDFCVFSSIRPCCRIRHSLLQRDTSLYLFGGLARTSANGPLVTLNDMWKFDLITETWTTLRANDCGQAGPMCLESLASTSVPPLGSLIYFGGRTLRTGLLTLSNTIWAYNAVPTITAPITAPSSPTTGGATITITGIFPKPININGNTPFVYVLPPATPLPPPSPSDLSFTTITRIPSYVSGSECTNVIAINENTFTCRTPPGVGSRARIVVETFDQTYFPSTPVVSIAYTPPSVQTVGYATPVMNDGGTIITVTGTGFGPSYTAPLLSVNIGIRPCSNITRFSPTQLMCIAGAGGGKLIPVTVRAGDSTTDVFSVNNSRSAVFSYQPPTVIKADVILSPGTVAVTTGKYPINIYGSGFGSGDPADTLYAKLGDQQCDSTRWVSSSLIICIAPPGVGASLPVTVTVGIPFSTLVTSPSSTLVTFSYAPPSLFSVSKRYFSIEGGEELIIQGSNFGVDAARLEISIAGKLCTNIILLQPHFTIRCITPQFKDEVQDSVIVKAGGQPQPDGNRITVTFTIPAVSSTLVRVFIVMGVMCLAAGASLVVYVLYHRAHKVIKASSPLFCMIAIIGGMILITAMLFLDPGGTDRTSTCHVSLWIGCLGFTILLGSLVFKNYRVLKIFQDGASLQQSPITTFQLMTMICLLLIIDVALLIGYEVTAPPCSQFTSPDVFTLSAGLAAFVILLIIYKLSLIVVGVYTAVRSRVIDIAEFSERHQLGYSIMTIAFSSIILAPASYSLRTQPSAAYTLRAIGLMVGSMGAIFCLMIPKMLAIRSGTGGTGLGTGAGVPSPNMPSRKYTLTTNTIRATPAITEQTLVREPGTLTKSDNAAISHDSDSVSRAPESIVPMSRVILKPNTFTPPPPPDIMSQPPPPPPTGAGRGPPPPLSARATPVPPPTPDLSREWRSPPWNGTPSQPFRGKSFLPSGKHKPLPQVPRPHTISIASQHENESMLHPAAQSSSAQTTPRTPPTTYDDDEELLEQSYQTSPLAGVIPSSFPSDITLSTQSNNGSLSAREAAARQYAISVSQYDEPPRLPTDDESDVTHRQSDSSR